MWLCIEARAAGVIGSCEPADVGTGKQTQGTWKIFKHCHPLIDRPLKPELDP